MVKAIRILWDTVKAKDLSPEKENKAIQIEETQRRLSSKKEPGTMDQGLREETERKKEPRRKTIAARKK